ncbi:hypothetical protein, partial [Nocardia gipuzkoensis]|uniref:hypothetical protein n=1 Tax=Nocardia gipuzkoensis TaxID=2749991 RepID=UPI00245679AD
APAPLTSPPPPPPPPLRGAAPGPPPPPPPPPPRAAPRRMLGLASLETWGRGAPGTWAFEPELQCTLPRGG